MKTVDFKSIPGKKNVGDTLKRRKFVIPSLVTAIGIFCGFLAMVNAFKGNLEYSVHCIALAFILDGLDGRIARRLNATSPFGREFDSLSDLVAFGIAPASLVYSWAYSELLDQFGILLAFIFVISGAARLARFNTKATNSVSPDKKFEGLPIPGAAMTLATIVYWHPEPIHNFASIIPVALYMLLISALMLSSISYFSPKRLSFPSISPRVLLIILCTVVALAWYFLRLALMLGFSIYALSGLFLYLKQHFVKK